MNVCAFIRPIGDFYATGQGAWLCDGCGHEEISCFCDDEPEDARCLHCDELLPTSVHCADCDDPAPRAKLGCNWTVKLVDHGNGRAEVQA